MFFIILRTKCALLVLVIYLSDQAFAKTESSNSQQQPISDEIIVTGSPLSATVGESLIGVSVISGEELANNLSGSLGETLKKTPGLSSTFFGPGASRPIIRGQGGARIRILDNGIGSIDAAAASPDHATSVEPAMASRIEIIRGSGLLRYGSSASGGVINVIDGRIPDSIPDNAITGAARIGASSVDDGIEGSIGVNLKIGDLGGGTMVGHLNTSSRRTNDYNIPGFAENALLHASEEEEPFGIVENSATRSRAFAGGLSWIGNVAMTGLAVRNLDSQYGIPGGHGEHPQEEGSGVTIDLKQTRIDGVTRIEFSGLFETLTINGGYGDYQHTEIEPDGGIGTLFANKGYELRAELVQAKHGNWQAAYGIQIQNRDFSAIGAEAFVPPTSSAQIGLFSFHELNLGNWHLEGSVRYENNRHENDTNSISRNFNSFSFAVGADYHLSETTRLGGTFFHTSRAPNTAELFSNGPHLATNQFEVGNSNLDNETATGGEISVRFRKGEARISLNIFTTYYRDYIYERATGNEQDSLPEFQFTAANVVFKGFEIDAGVKLASINNFDILADITLEYVDANLVLEGISLPRIPPLSLGAGLVLQNDTWRLRAEIDYAARQNDLAPNTLPTNVFALINLQSSYRISERITLRSSINNLLNSEARQHTSYLKESVPLPGRNFKLGLTLVF
ncbi:MAG: TonB-dependent receptor [Robiginitomaculum sp.]|nr:TonB-dependent receptor [Robiginitomaculum sp.]